MDSTSAMLVKEGETALLEGEFEKASWALDAALFLCPSIKPQLWQRGLCCFYTGRYKEGMDQFETDMSENGNDIEEVVWHFLCKSKLVGFKEASRTGFLPLKQATIAPPPPMSEVLLLFNSQTTVDAVIAAATAEDGSVVKSYNDTNALAYAHFYIGLLYEVQGHIVKSERHLSHAARLENPDFMGQLMRMHYRLFAMTAVRRASVPSMTISASSSTPYITSSIILGGWQLSDGHSSIRVSKSHLLSSLLRAVDRGITSFDCGDIYTGVEELYGGLINSYCRSGRRREDIHIHTKLVPDLDLIKSSRVDQDYVNMIVRRSLNRLRTTYIDLVQFHWWDYTQPGYVEAAQSLQLLQKEGLVRQIGLTNFDTDHTRELLSAGVPVASTQVQLSLLDRRPLHSGLLQLCRENTIAVVAYGVLAGGFLSDAWCGRALPQQLANRSLVKYLLIIEEFGGWELFQHLLQVLKSIADKHPPVVLGGREEDGGSDGVEGSTTVPVTVAMVAVAYVYSIPGVSGVIIGSLKPNYLDEATAATRLTLSAADYAAIDQVLASSRGPQGEVFQLERESSRHSGIMKCNLNQLNQPAHLEELCTRYLELFFRAYPEEATRSGYRQALPDCTQDDILCSSSSNLSFLHALSYDHALTLSSAHEIDEHCNQVKQLLAEALGIDAALLDQDQSVDRDLIISQLRLELVKWREVRMSEKDPAFYLHFVAVNYLLPVWGGEDNPVTNDKCSLYDLSHPGVAELSITHRLLALVSRLRAFPQSFENAKENLTSPVHIFVERAISLCKSFVQFLTHGFLQLVQSLASYEQPASKLTAFLVKEVGLAARVAAESIDQYNSWLEKELLGKAIHTSGVGREVYDKLLLYGHFIGSSDELLAMGEKHFAKVKNQLEEVAHSIDPNKNWQEITELIIRRLHPTANELLQSYLEEIHRAREFFTTCDVLPDLPAGESVVGFHTPSCLVTFSPFGDFLNPAPFAVSSSEIQRHRTGFLMLHSVKAMGLSPQDEESLLQAHDYSWISVIAPHECYPGHHVQALLAQQHPRLLRKFYESTLFYEGWGLYCENLAYEVGFFKKDLQTTAKNGAKEVKVSADEFEKMSRLTQLRLQLWRSARIILDVKFHRGELTFAQCQEFLQNEVMFKSRSTAGEVFMYASRPTYASCYVAGFLNLLQLREDTKRTCIANGKEFKLKDFHRFLLSKGCLPFELLQTYPLVSS